MEHFFEAIGIFFSNGFFMPHGHCYLWKPAMVWSHVVSDSLIALAYYSIPLVLLKLVRERKDLPFSWMFLCFGAFIVFCGTTHLMEVYNVWHSAYGLAAVIKMITAALSIMTAILLVPLVKKALLLPSPERLKREIAERIQIENTLRETQDQVIQLQKLEAVGRLAGGVAHDFNNILTGLIGIAGDLEHSMEASDPRHAEVLDIQKLAERAARLTRQLLAFSRKQVVSPKVLHLNALIRDMEKMLKRFVGDEVTLRMEFSSEDPCIFMDPSQVEQIIVNLAINARDAMPGGGLLLFKTAIVECDADLSSAVDVSPGSYAVITLKDSGTGMTPDVLSKIFEPFFTTKEIGKGTGLGLPTVYGIVKQNKGGVAVQSAAEKGTTFDVYLPRFVGTAQNPLSDEASGTRGDRRGHESILVVDDEESIVRFVFKALTRQGYQVTTANSGAQALTLLAGHQGPLDLLLTDVMMPGLNGTQLAENIRKDFPTIKILFMSGYPKENLTDQGVLREGIEFISKPFSVEALGVKLRSILDGEER